MFTYKRLERLKVCLKSLSNNDSISEVLIFNDDETESLSVDSLGEIANLFKNIKLFNPSDFGFEGRSFRKHKYLNLSLDIIKENRVFFSDDDGYYSKGAIDAHDRALNTHHFSAGGIVRSKIFRHTSSSILQGTNYAFRKNLIKDIGGYDEAYAASFGGGDAEFWYRIYNYITKNNLSAALLPKVKQVVIGKSTRRGATGTMSAKDYTKNKHNLEFDGPMYKWFRHIRDKKRWMTIIK